jgi:hypothetical protein
VGYYGYRLPSRKSVTPLELLGASVDQFGPFAVVVGIAFALVAVFTAFVPQMLGKVERWTYLTSDAPTFLVRGGAQIAVIAVIGVTFVFVDKSNYRWFLLAALVMGLIGSALVIKFDHLRKVHVVQIPIVGSDGQQLTGPKGEPQSKNVSYW